ncbi:MAG: double-strand break repair protein AddB [Alphaproteobacteria bacterium]
MGSGCTSEPRKLSLTRKSASPVAQLDIFGGDASPGRIARTEAAGRIFTIAQSAPFLDTLARAILAGNLPRDGGKPPSPADIADTLIYLPNRAACRAMAGAFLRASGNNVTLLPRMRPLGSAEEDALLLLQPDTAEAGVGADGMGYDLDRPELPLPPAVGALERRMVLTKLILAWAERLRSADDLDDEDFSDDELGLSPLRIASTPAAAAEMALDLMRLLDEAQTEGVDLGRIRELLPERFAGHEQLSLSFLKIAVETWPGYLTATKRLDPVERRNGIMALEAERLRTMHADTPVIVAGSTGSIPATAALMRTVMELPRGAIVLPGLDMALDTASWRAVAEHPEHPQAGLFQLLEGLGARRNDVATVHGVETAAGDAENADAHRLAFLSETMRPASTMGAWPQYIAGADREAVRDALAGVSLIAAPTEQDEAAAIALMLREAAETPDKTAVLVTPDQTLARRVSAELMRWNLAINGATGEPLRTTPAGVFHDLIAEFAATGSQIALLGLLKHPFTRVGLPEGHANRAAKLLEIAGMRQTWCGDGLDELSRSLHLAKKAKPRHPAIDLFSEDDWEAASDLLHRLKEAMWPLTQLARSGAVPFAEMAKAHAAVAEALMRGEEPETDEAKDAATDASHVQLTAFMDTLTGDAPAPDVTLADYPALFRSLIRLERMPPSPSTHPRLSILTPMEARTATADLAIIAGLNEGTWPAAAAPGPWLNRAMRAALGLPPPERSIRLAAHNFAQMMGAREVILTRALKSDGAPTVASRWLMRMEALLQGLGLENALAPKHPWLAWAAARNAVELRPSPPAPAPCPPLFARPRRLSVSAIETLIANPYAIFARHILALSPLPPLEGEPENSDRGRLIHEALHHFARSYDAELPPAIVNELLAMFDECARLFDGHARVSAFWRPRLERFARWFAETEAARRDGARVFSEVSGELTMDAPGGAFTLTARAER